MTTCAVIGWSLAILIACIAAVVALAWFIDDPLARQCEDDPYGM